MSDDPRGRDPWRDEIRRRLVPLGLPPIHEAEIVEELAQHLDDRYREFRAYGHAHEAADAMAWRELEDADVLRREFARVETRASLELLPPGAPARGRSLSAFWQDLRYAARTLRAAPGFTWTVLFAVALSTGPTTAILSIGDWLLWRPHPGVTDSSRLAEVWIGRWAASNSVMPSWVTYDDLEHLSGRATTILGIAGGQELSASLAVHGRLPRTAGTAHVTANFFSVLGVRMRAGRAFLAEEDRLPGAAVAVISEGLAASVFGSPEAALGQSISLNSRPFSVVGVTHADFGGTSPMDEVDVWVPRAIYHYLNHWTRAPEPPGFYSFVVRMRTNAGPRAVESELNELLRGLTLASAEHRERLEGIEARVFPGLGVFPLMRESTRATVHRMLWVGLALLLIGCANIANLLVLRTTRRAHEIGIRKALGATASRLVQMQLMEACLLATAGAALGLVLAVLLKELIQTLMFPEPAGVVFVVPLNWRVLAATGGAALTSGLLAAAAPAWLAARGAVLRPGMSAGSRTTTRVRSLRGVLAALQLALSLTLLVGALLLVTSLRNLRAIDLGFDPAGITVLHVDLQQHGYPPERQLPYFRAVLHALEAHGEFEAVTLAERAPFGSGARARVEAADGSDPIEVGTNAITHRYFEVLRTPLLRGRAFTEAESLAPTDDPPLVINETLARRLFGSVDAVGRTLRLPRDRTRPARDLPIIGVAHDAHWNHVAGAPEPFLYYPLGGYYRFGRGTFIVRSSLPALHVAGVAGEIAARFDRDVPLSSPRALTTDIDEPLADERLFAWVLSLLAALGFFLASFGLYGLVAQTVAERGREFGIRIALGAGRGAIVRLVAAYAAIVSTAGIMVGLGLSLAGTRFVQSMLYGVTRLDPAVYVAAATALVAAVALACVGPVLRALRVQPVDVLRAE